MFRQLSLLKTIHVKQALFKVFAITEVYAPSVLTSVSAVSLIRVIKWNVNISHKYGLADAATELIFGSRLYKMVTQFVGVVIHRWKVQRRLANHSIAIIPEPPRN